MGNSTPNGNRFRGDNDTRATRVVRPKAVRTTSGVHFKPEEPKDYFGATEGPVPAQPVYGASSDWDPFTAQSYDAGSRSASHQHHHHHRHRHHRSHAVLITIICVVVALLAAAGVSGYLFYQSAKAVAADAGTLVAETSTFSKSLAGGDTAALSSSAEKISALSSEMTEESSGPLWSVAENLPQVGPDIAKVRTLVSVASDLSANVVTPAAQNLSGVTMGTVFSNGKIDIATLQTLCNTITQIQPAIAASAARVDALGAPQLEQLKEPLSKAKTTLDSLNEAATGLAKVAPSLPAMLGANGTRNYLVIAQNNSEIRSTGGFPGSRMLMTIDNGQIELESFEAVGTHFPAGTIPLTDEEYAVVNDLMQTGATFAPGDVNAVPSFPRAAQLMEWCWEEEGNDDVDGVIAIDPVFLQSLLALTGGVTTSDGTVVDGTNAAQILLNETYYLPTDEQDPFFSEVAGLAVKKIMGSLGSVSTTDLASTLTAGTEQGRFLLYMDDPAEEATVTDLGADGEVNQDAANPVTGFYIYDKTGSKLDWYLDMRSSVSAPVQNADGTKSYNVTVTLHNTTTLEQMEDELPSYITGLTPEVHHYSMITSYLAMAPAGGTISNFQVSADEVNAEGEASLYGNDVWAGFVNIYPSNTATFTYTVTVPAGTQTDLAVWTTPTGRSFA